MAIEVVLPLLEAILLFALALRCLRERDLSRGDEKVNSHLIKSITCALSESFMDRRILLNLRNNYYARTYYWLIIGLDSGYHGM
jgi:hypothetical protein